MVCRLDGRFFNRWDRTNRAVLVEELVQREEMMKGRWGRRSEHRLVHVKVSYFRTRPTAIQPPEINGRQFESSAGVDLWPWTDY